MWHSYKVFFDSIVAAVVVLLLNLYQPTYNHRSVSYSLFKNFKPHTIFVRALPWEQEHFNDQLENVYLIL